MSGREELTPESEALLEDFDRIGTNSHRLREAILAIEAEARATAEAERDAAVEAGLVVIDRARAAEAERDRLREALDKAGRYIAAWVQPNPSKKRVLDAIEAALAPTVAASEVPRPLTPGEIRAANAVMRALGAPIPPEAPSPATEAER